MWDRAKAIEAVVYLANRIDDPTKMKIFKLLYFADKLHMSRYGRFIIGDYYAAMKHGPVPSATYNIVKEVEAGRENSAFSLPDARRISAKRKADLREFSETDIECLEETLRIYGRASATQLRKLSHSDAWNKVTDDGRMFDDESGGPQSVPIPLGFIVDELPNAPAVRELLQTEGYLPLTE